MKTIDEVIKANECCDHGETDSRCEDCPYNGIGACCAEREFDALNYLKEYKRISARLEKIALGNITETLEKFDNPPLTWDELRTMEGKPVWVEADYFEKGWLLVDASLADIWVTGYDCAEHQLREEAIGISWQAYRKERYESTDSN